MHDPSKWMLVSSAVPTYLPISFQPSYSPADKLAALKELYNDDTIWGFNTALNGLSECQHQWQDYQGFNEFYKFCTKCDQKQYQK